MPELLKLFVSAAVGALAAAGTDILIDRVFAETPVDSEAETSAEPQKEAP